MFPPHPHYPKDPNAHMESSGWYMLSSSAQKVPEMFRPVDVGPTGNRGKGEGYPPHPSITTGGLGQHRISTVGKAPGPSRWCRRRPPRRRGGGALPSSHLVTLTLICSYVSILRPLRICAHILDIKTTMFSNCLFLLF